MKTMKGSFQLLALAGIVALSATPALAADIAAPGPEDATNELRVVNDFSGAVEVFVQDADGQTHRLGTVRSTERATLEVPAGVATAGAFQIKVIPTAPTWAPWTSAEGIRTHAFEIPEGVGLNLWLEMDLKDSRVEVAGH